MPNAEVRPVSHSPGSTTGVQGWSWWGRMWAPFWAVPLVCTVAAVVLGVVLPGLDLSVSDDLPFIFPGGPEGARALLGTIAGAMISVTGLVFSLTIVVLQLASSQFTPRLLGSFLESRLSQATLGAFIASFVFALTVLRSVQGESTGDAFVPQLSVSIAYLLVLASVVQYLAFINHITTSIQVSHAISRVGDQTMRLVERLYPHPQDAAKAGPTWSPRPETSRRDLPLARRHGHIVSVDTDALVRASEKAGGVVVLDRQVGDFVINGQSLGQCWGGELGDDELNSVAAAIVIRSERTMRQDVRFGIRQLVDIAERALSPGINDPTTAVRAINELHYILREVLQRVTPSPYYFDSEGDVRLVHTNPNVQALLILAVEEIAHYGRDSIQVSRRLRAMLDDLETCGLAQHRASLSQVRELVGKETS